MSNFPITKLSNKLLLLPSQTTELVLPSHICIGFKVNDLFFYDAYSVVVQIGCFGMLVRSSKRGKYFSMFSLLHFLDIE